MVLSLCWDEPDVRAVPGVTLIHCWSRPSPSGSGWQPASGPEHLALTAGRGWLHPVYRLFFSSPAPRKTQDKEKTLFLGCSVILLSLPGCAWHTLFTSAPLVSGVGVLMFSLIM